MYYAERSNPDPATQKYYTSIPRSMWITLLNLSGESPLCDYTVVGKITTGMLGIFAVGWFSIPVGLVGAGFEEWIDSLEDEDEEDSGFGKGCGNVFFVSCSRDRLKNILLTSQTPTTAGVDHSRIEEGFRYQSLHDINANAERMESAEFQVQNDMPLRTMIYKFVEGRTQLGVFYELWIIALILWSTFQAVGFSAREYLVDPKCATHKGRNSETLHADHFDR